MKIIVFTSDALRHKYIANTLSEHAEDVLVVSEHIPHRAASYEDTSPLIREHFALRDKAERDFWGEHETFRSPVIPIAYKEVNLPFVYEAAKRYRPDAAFVFGSWIIKEPLLSLIPRGRFINLHLGLSPYYRGSGTNFWPLINGEPEYIGATLLHIDAGIDTGDIIAHVRPTIAADDTAHTIGCKTIIKGGEAFQSILEIMEKKGMLPRVKQWACPNERFYKKSDFNEDALRRYYSNIEKGLLREYIRDGAKEMKLVSAENLK